MEDKKVCKINFEEIREAVKPDNFWVSENRKVLMNQIGNTVSEKNLSNTGIVNKIGIQLESFVQIFVSNRLAKSVKPVFVSFLIVLMVFGGWSAGVSASFDSLPGEFMWSVKRATEKTELAMASLTKPDDEQAKLHLKHAQRRAEEINKVVKRKEPEFVQKAEVAVKELKKSLESASENIVSANEKSPEKLVGMMIEVGNTTDNISKSLSDSLGEVGEQEGVEGNQQQQVVKDVTEIKKMAEDVGLDTMTSIIKSNEENKIVLDEQKQTEVKNIVKGKLESFLSDIEVEVNEAGDLVAKNIKKDDLDNAIDEEISTVKEGKKEESVSVSTEVSSSSPSTTLSAEDNQSLEVNSTGVGDEKIINIKEAVDKVNKKTEEIQSDAKEGVEMIDNNNLLDAIQMVKKLNESVQEVKEATSEVKKAVVDKAAQDKITEDKKGESVLKSVTNTISNTVSTENKNNAVETANAG